MTVNYSKQKELISFYHNAIELISLCGVIKYIFRLFRSVTQYFVHWAMHNCPFQF